MISPGPERGPSPNSATLERRDGVGHPRGFFIDAGQKAVYEPDPRNASPAPVVYSRPPGTAKAPGFNKSVRAEDQGAGIAKRYAYDRTSKGVLQSSQRIVFIIDLRSLRMEGLPMRAEYRPAEAVLRSLQNGGRYRSTQ